MQIGDKNRFHWSDLECSENWESYEYGDDEPYEFAYLDFFESAEHEADLRIHSLLPAFKATDEYPLVFQDDPHWNPAGHRFVAAVVANYVLAEGLVKPN